MSEHGAAGENFDVIGAVVCQLAHHLPHFPRAIRLTVMKIPWEGDVGSEAGGCAGTAGYSYISSRNEHARPDDVATIDGVAQGDVAQSAIRSNIAHRGETRFEHGSGIRNGLERYLRRRLFELPHRLGIVRAVSQMSVAIDKAGKNRHAAEIDDVGVGWDRQAGAYSLNFSGANENG